MSNNDNPMLPVPSEPEPTPELHEFIADIVKQECAKLHEGAEKLHVGVDRLHAAIAHVEGPADPVQAQRSKERHELLDDIVAHVVAVIMSIGFFFIVLIALLGYADLASATVAAFVGTALGYAAAKLDPIFTRYYHVTISEQRKAVKSEEQS